MPPWGMPANEFDRKNVIRSLREDVQILHMETYTCKWLHVHEESEWSLMISLMRLFCWP